MPNVESNLLFDQFMDRVTDSCPPYNSLERARVDDGVVLAGLELLAEEDVVPQRAVLHPRLLRNLHDRECSVLSDVLGHMKRKDEHQPLTAVIEYCLVFWIT